MYENMYLLLVVCIADDDEDDLVEIFSMDLLFEVGIILLYILRIFFLPLYASLLFCQNIIIKNNLTRNLQIAVLIHNRIQETKEYIIP
jgi:hypothetical protein